MKADKAIEILKTWRITGDKTHEALDMAIDALAKDINVPINDCISRKAATDEVKRLHDVAWTNWKETRISANTMIDALKELPSAQPEPSDVARDIATIIENEKDMRVVLQKPQWIPCSERLPEGYGNYLVSIRGEEPDIGTINPKDERGWSLCDATGFYWASEKKLDVIAWMPLPESYRGDADE